MQIEIKTAAYAENKNFVAIMAALEAGGFRSSLQLGGKMRPAGEAVTITTDAPASALDGVQFAKSAVTIRA